MPRSTVAVIRQNHLKNTCLTLLRFVSTAHNGIFGERVEAETNFRGPAQHHPGGKKGSGATISGDPHAVFAKHFTFWVGNRLKVIEIFSSVRGKNASAFGLD